VVEAVEQLHQEDQVNREEQVVQLVFQEVQSLEVVAVELELVVEKHKVVVELEEVEMVVVIQAQQQQQEQLILVAVEVDQQIIVEENLEVQV
jgi:hypothetical protein